MTSLVSGQAAKQVLERIQRSSPVPLGVHLQISDRCNHACAHCYQIQGNKGELSTGEWVAALERLAKAGVLFLTVSGGEPTLRPDLLEILQVAVRLGFSVRLFTNGYLIDGEMADRLARMHLLAVHLSLYSHIPGEHDALTRVPGAWLATTSAVRQLVERGVNVMIKWVSLAGSSASQSDMLHLSESLGATLRPASMVMAREDGDTKPSYRMMKSGADLTQVVGDQAISCGADLGMPTREHLCGACRTSIAILPNGKVLPCVGISHEIGDIRHDRLEAIVRGPDSEFLRGLSWEHIHGCRDCALKPFCGKCLADAFHHAGDLLGPCVTSCRYARARWAASTRAVLEPSTPDTGPYQWVGGRLEALPDMVSEADFHVRTRFPWVVRSPKEHLLAQRCSGC